MDFAEIRRTAITALFSDDVLTEYLVLKGGNALDLVYGITSRTSLDLDFSMSQDFEDLSDARDRLFASLRDRFDAVGYVVFDEQLASRPDLVGADEKPWWGGYELSFKLIERQKYHQLKDRLDKLRINSLVIGSGEKRSFKIDLSKCEYTDGKAEYEIDHFRIYVYTPAMIAIEKLRAICQQMPVYPHTGNRRARARDFYDIYKVVNFCGLDLSTDENAALMQHIFSAKQVPLSLLGKITEQREFHRPDWAAVVAATKEDLYNFDVYFDFVTAEVDRLKSSGIV